MKKRRLLALLLALTMLVALLAGCAGKEEEAPASEPPASEAPAPESTAPEAPPAEEAPAEGEAAEEGGEGKGGHGDLKIAGTYNADGTYTSEGGITYPLGEIGKNGEDSDYYLTYFCSFGFFDQGVDTYNDLPRRADILEATGVYFEFHEVGFSVASEQFNLMCAAGDLPDLCKVDQFVTGGVGQAYEEEYIYDLTDMVEEYAPDWWAALQNTNKLTIDNAYTEGHILEITNIKNENILDSGALTRGDWVDEMGVEIPETKQEFEDFLYAIQAEYNPEIPLFVQTTGVIPDMQAAFNTAIFEIGNSTVSTYLDDGVVKSGMTSDGYREYLEWFKQLYDDGIIHPEFYADSLSEEEQFGLIGKGQGGVWNNTSGSLEAAALYLDEANADMYAEPIPKILNDEGVYDFGSEIVLASESYSITTNCEYPEVALQFYNWFFTEPGSTLANWGKEGVSYDVDADGEKYWREEIIGPDAGTWDMWLAVWKECPYLEDVWVNFATNTDQENKCLEVWNRSEHLTTDHTIPNAAALTTEETTQVATMATDLCTYASEEVLKFIIGEKELNDENWNAYVDQCNKMNLEEIVAVYQNAYEEYLSGERTAGAAAPPPPPPPPPQ
ncbi:MAG: hypothetical protein E7430_04170 [Ruminococcaceae bacterium]|nr:hypothetical protein [Oscillospiraceae bacterium]